MDSGGFGLGTWVDLDGMKLIVILLVIEGVCSFVEDK